ncbi:glycosyltransferase [Candidatus Daviesbacteria bacterium]|nr:glycosyltransferase [Candidatus Daviesbacteria bacterium]
MKKLSVVIPAYNEERNLKRGVLDAVEDFLEKSGLEYEVMVVDDGSTDATREVVKGYVAKNNNFRLIENSHGGKAMAVMTGMLKAKGEIVLFTDMDQATPIDQWNKFLPKFEEGLPAGRQGYDVVIGSRSGRKGAPMVRQLAAWGFSFLRGIILGLPFSDTQCGFKAFNREAIEKIIPKIKSEWGVVHFKGGAVNAGFDVELLYLAKKYGFKIAEVEVVWNYVDTERVQVIKDALAAIYDMLRIRINDLKGKY